MLLVVHFGTYTTSPLHPCHRAYIKFHSQRSIWVTKMPLLESKASTKTACVSTAPVFNKNSGNAKEDSGWWALVHHNKGVSEAPVYVLGRLCVCANILIYYFDIWYRVNTRVIIMALCNILWSAWLACWYQRR